MNRIEKANTNRSAKCASLAADDAADFDNEESSTGGRPLNEESNWSKNMKPIGSVSSAVNETQLKVRR